MKVVLSGGGTSGHISPALSIAEALISSNKDCEFLFIGRAGGDENRAVANSNIRLETLEIYGIERRITLRNIKNLLIAVKAIREAKKKIKDFKPDVVVGTGGYVCFPVLYAAQHLRIPTIIHESNASPGLVTRLLASKCDRVLLNLEGSSQEFKKIKNTRVVGNPVRSNFLNSDKKTARKKLGLDSRDFLVSSFGGSGGSQKLNDVIIDCIRKYSSKNKKIKHIHSTGKKYYETVKERNKDLFSQKNNCIIMPFIEDMATVISASDVVISRCGAITIAELSAIGNAAILIPSPNVTDNHQYKNAKLLADNGAAIMIEEKNLTSEKLYEVISELENNPKKRRAMSEKIKIFYIKDSSNKIAEEILSLI